MVEKSPPPSRHSLPGCERTKDRPKVALGVLRQPVCYHAVVLRWACLCPALSGVRSKRGHPARELGVAHPATQPPVRTNRGPEAHSDAIVADMRDVSTISAQQLMQQGSLKGPWTARKPSRTTSNWQTA